MDGGLRKWKRQMWSRMKLQILLYWLIHLASQRNRGMHFLYRLCDVPCSVLILHFYSLQNNISFSMDYRLLGMWIQFILVFLTKWACSRTNRIFPTNRSCKIHERDDQAETPSGTNPNCTRPYTLQCIETWSFWSKMGSFSFLVNRNTRHRTLGRRKAS